MAHILKLTDRDANTLNLWDDVFTVTNWTSRSNGDGTATEEFILKGRGTFANLMAAEKKIENFANSAVEYATTSAGRNYVYLYAYADGTLYYKRSHVLGIDIYPVNQGKINQFYSDGGAIIKLIIDREDVWESVSGSAVTAQDQLIDGSSNISIDSLATIESRLYLFQAYNYETDYITSPITELWFGMRPEYAGSSSFESLWSLGEGTAVDADTTDQGTYMDTTFANDATMIERVKIRVDDIYSSNYTHAAGRYLVLLRAKVDAGTVCNVKMETGIDGGLFSKHEPVEVTATNYMLHPLGEVQFPPDGLKDYSMLSIRACQIKLSAERTTGTGSDKIYWDDLILIPSEHMLYINGANIDYAAGTYNFPVEVYTLPGNRRRFYATSAGATDNTEPNKIVEGYSHNFFVPAGENVGVFAAQAATAHNKTDKISYKVTFYNSYMHQAS